MCCWWVVLSRWSLRAPLWVSAVPHCGACWRGVGWGIFSLFCRLFAWLLCVLVLGIGFCGSLFGFGCFLPPSSSILLPPPPPFLLSSSPSFSVSHLFRFQPCLVVFFSLLHPPWLRAKLWSFLDVNFLQGSVVTRVCFCGLGLSKAVCLY